MCRCQMIPYGLSFIKFHSTAPTSGTGNALSSATSDTKTSVSALCTFCIIYFAASVVEVCLTLICHMMDEYILSCFLALQ